MMMIMTDRSHGQPERREIFVARDAPRPVRQLQLRNVYFPGQRGLEGAASFDS